MGTCSLRAHVRRRWRNRNTCGGRAWPSSGQGPAWPVLCEPGGCGEGGDWREGDRARLLVGLQQTGWGVQRGRSAGTTVAQEVGPPWSRDRGPPVPCAAVTQGGAIRGGRGGGHSPSREGQGSNRREGPCHRAPSPWDVRGGAACPTPEADPRQHHAGAGSWETGPVRLPVESEQGPRGA